MNDYPLKSALSNTKLKAYICAIMEAPSSLMLYDLDTGEWRINNFLNTELTSWNILDSEFITQLDQQLVPDLMNGTDLNHKVFSIQFNTIKLPNSITFSIRCKQSELCKTLLVFHVSYRKPYTERSNVEMYKLRDRLLHILLPDFIVLSDPWCNIKYANKSYCRFFGYDVTKVKGQNYLQNLPSDQKEAYLSRFQKLTPEQNSISNTHLIQSVTGKKQWTLWTEIVVFNENDEMYEILSVGRNVEELVDLSRKNRENSTLLLDILTKVSHNIRPPICNLIALSDHCNEMLEDKNLSKEWIQSFTTLVYELDHLSIELSNVIDNKIDHTYEL